MYMMTKTKSSVNNRYKFLSIIPVCIGLIIIYSFTNLKPNNFNGSLNEKSDQKNDKISFIVPIDQAKLDKVTARFGNIFNPSDNKEIFHKGIDFKAPAGTNVFAGLEGKIILTEISDEAYGNQIIIQHSEVYQTRYAHLDKILVKKGQTVNQGDVIGTVGNTGKSTGPHLHFEIMKNGEPVNPEHYFHNITLINSEDEQVYHQVDIMPKFNETDDGTFINFRKYIKENLNYPDEAAKQGLEGKVFVQFIINEKGEVEDSKIVKSVNQLLDDEALRVINSCPNWIPGEKNGNPVNVQFTFPIVFALN